MNTQTKDFDNWTEYNDWNIANYTEFSVVSLNEIEGGKVRAEYMPNEQWLEEAKKIADEKEARAKAQTGGPAEAAATPSA